MSVQANETVVVTTTVTPAVHQDALPMGECRPGRLRWQLLFGGWVLTLV